MGFTNLIKKDNKEKIVTLECDYMNNNMILKKEKTAEFDNLMDEYEI